MKQDSTCASSAIILGIRKEPCFQMLIHCVSAKSAAGLKPAVTGDRSAKHEFVGLISFFRPSRTKKNQQALNPAGFSDLDLSRPVQYIDPSRSLIDAQSISVFLLLHNFISGFGKYFDLYVFYNKHDESLDALSCVPCIKRPI